MESHLYDCMAAIALSHNFTWSRWNFLSGRRSCVLLMREIVENRKTVRIPPRLETFKKMFYKFVIFLADPFHASCYASKSNYYRLHRCFAVFQPSWNRRNGGLISNADTISTSIFSVPFHFSSMLTYINYLRLIRKPFHL